MVIALYVHQKGKVTVEKTCALKDWSCRYGTGQFNDLLSSHK